MPDFPNSDLVAVREQLLDGMRSYKEVVGDKCDYGDEGIEKCASILDAYVVSLQERPQPSQERIREAVKKVVLELNDLNAECGHSLIETDQRELLCEVILVAAAKAGLETSADITEAWREW